MRRFLALLLAAFIGLMPLVGMACGASQAAAPGTDAPCHSQDPMGDKDPTTSCAEIMHCCAATLASAALTNQSPLALEEPALPTASPACGFVPDPQHRPPVVL